jgi:hypothetical protein
MTFKNTINNSIFVIEHSEHEQHFVVAVQAPKQVSSTASRGENGASDDDRYENNQPRISIASCCRKGV